MNRVTPKLVEASRPSPSTLQLSIVIASWNNWKCLDPCLASVPNGGAQSYEVIVVDNASTDETLTSLQERYPQVRLVANSVNQGHCRAINQGIRLAGGEYILVLDGDTVMWPEAASRLIEFLRLHMDVAIAAPRMLNADGTAQETARSFPTVLNGLFGRQSVLTRLLPHNRFVYRYLRRENIENTEPFETDWVSAACMIFRRSLSERIGLWDEGFSGYWVDADWCRAAKVAGKIYCVPVAHVTHFEQSRSGKKKGAGRIVHFHIGAHRFYRKHYTLGLLDPRSLVACLALAGRAAVLLLADLFQRPAEGHEDPACARRFSMPEAQRDRSFDVRIRGDRDA